METISFILVILFLMIFVVIQKLADNKKIENLENKLMALISPGDYRRYKSQEIDIIKQQTKLTEAQEKVLEKQNPFTELSNV